MMINDMKKNELNEQEIENVAGGYNGTDYFRWEQEQALYRQDGQEAQEAPPFHIGGVEVGTAWESLGTAWKVIKHAFDVCG